MPHNLTDLLNLQYLSYVNCLNLCGYTLEVSSYTMASQLTPAMLADTSSLRQYPAGEPPPGISPDFLNPENQGPILVAVGGLMISFMIPLLINRIYTKTCIVRKFAWDDLTVSLSALGAIALYTICCCGRLLVDKAKDQC